MGLHDASRSDKLEESDRQIFQIVERVEDGMSVKFFRPGLVIQGDND